MGQNTSRENQVLVQWIGKVCVKQVVARFLLRRVLLYRLYKGMPVPHHLPRILLHDTLLLDSLLFLEGQFAGCETDT